MKIRKTRWLAFFCAAMLVASNAMAAAHLCVVERAVPQHQTTQMELEDGQQDVCPDATGTSIDPNSCAQAQKGDNQKFSSDAPALVIAPPTFIPRAWFPPVTTLVPASYQTPVGPPPTILFGNLRI